MNKSMTATIRSILQEGPQVGFCSSTIKLHQCPNEINPSEATFWTYLFQGPFSWDHIWGQSTDQHPWIKGKLTKIPQSPGRNLGLPPGLCGCHWPILTRDLIGDRKVHGWQRDGISPREMAWRPVSENCEVTGLIVHKGYLGWTFT